MKELLIMTLFFLGFSSCNPISPSNSNFSSSVATPTSSASSFEGVLSLTITGLATGNLLGISNGKGEYVLAMADGNYSFSHKYSKGDSYFVSVIGHPTGQNCTIPVAVGSISQSTTTLLVVCSSDAFTVGGTVSGLSGTLILQQGTELKTITSDGTFIMSNSVDYQSSYNVSVYSNPTGQSCSVSNGSGTMELAGISNVSVTCTNNSYTMGGTVSGLTGSVTINNLTTSESQTISLNGSYNFSTGLTHGSSYSTAIIAHPTVPTNQTCLIDNSSGTINGGNVSNINLTCSDSYKIGGTVSGLAAGGSLVLTNNGGDDKIIMSNVTYQFLSGVFDGNIYDVRVKTQPIGQNCVVSNGNGTVASSIVSNINVACTSYSYYVGGNVSGMISGGTLTLQNNGGDDKNVTSDSSFTFDTSIDHALTYAATVLTNPTGQTCSVTDATGTINGSNISNIAVNCSTDSYDVSVDVLGTLTSDVIITNNGIDDLTITSSDLLSTVAFSTQIPHQNSYSVAVKTQPTNEKCVVGSGSGTMNGSSITSTLTCSTSYNIGGTLTGLASNVSIGLDNTGDPLTLTTNGAYTFPNKMITGENLNVSIATQPTGQGCIITGTAAATVTTDDFLAADILCTSNTYTLGGTISGLSNQTIVLINNSNGETINTSTDGSFAFPTSVAFDTTYDVQVNTQPTGRTCTVSNGSATHDTASNITNVNVSCDTATYTLTVDVGSNSGVVSPITLQNNVTDDLTVSSTGQFSFSTKINYNDAYSVSISSYPANHTCEVLNGSGNMTGDVSDVSVDCYLNVDAYFSNADDWNEYVRSYSQNTPCDGTETRYDYCLHGGETRKVVTPYSSCSSLSMRDNLGVFDWSCSSSTGTATFSSKLKKDKGLKHLVNIGGAFNANYVTLTNDTTDVLNSKSSTSWWSNSIDVSEALNTGVLSNPSTIYVITGDVSSSGLIFTNSNIAAVTLDGTSCSSSVTVNNINASGDTGAGIDRKALIAGNSQNFLWIEGDFIGNTDNYLIYLWNSKFTRIHNFDSSGGNYGVYLNNSDYNIILGSHITNVSNDGITFYESDNNYLGYSKISDATNGIYSYYSNSGVIDHVATFNNLEGAFFEYSNYNVIASTVASNNSGDGVRLYSSDSNRLFALTLSNNKDDGLELDGSSDSNIINNILLHNNADYGLSIISNSNYNYVAQIAARSNGTNEVNLNTTSYNKFDGAGLFPVVTNFCNVSGGIQPGLDPVNCSATDRSSGYFNELSLSTLSSTFVGVSSANALKSTLNFNDSSTDSGVWMYYTISAYPHADYQNRCDTGDNCIYFDYRINSSDTRILNHSGDGMNNNDTFTGGIACPSEVNGTEYFMKESSPSYILFLKNAVEILDDFRNISSTKTGDNDGLCEGSENCLYMPNLGAYQGSGDTTSCTFSEYGSFSNIGIYGHETNGE